MSFPASVEMKEVGCRPGRLFAKLSTCSCQSWYLFKSIGGAFDVRFSGCLFRGVPHMMFRICASDVVPNLSKELAFVQALELVPV